MGQGFGDFGLPDTDDEPDRTAQHARTLKFREDDSFKIVQLTDLYTSDNADDFLAT